MEEQQYFEWLLKTLSNPSDWCEAFLMNPDDPQENIKLRSYQKDVLLESPNNRNMAIRMGRRTGKTVVLCADILWWCLGYPLYTLYTTKGSKQIPFEVLVLTPGDAQIKVIFDTLIKLIGDSSVVKNEIQQIKRSDVNEIKFKNGSIIKGMTLGINSANKGTNVRGQSCDLILLDEADFIPQAIMEEAVLPIASTKLTTRMRVCSTPTGRKELFYKWCTRGKEIGWWTKHIPSWHPDNPSWISIEKAERIGMPIAESTEYQFRSVTTDAAYNREYGAEFGEEGSGVFKHKFINDSSVKYFNTYVNHDTDYFNAGFEQNTRNIYGIGVDWNTYKNGGQVVMIEYCREKTLHTYYDSTKQEEVTIDFTGKIRLFYRRGIKAKDATQRETRKEIIKLMTNYKVDYLYVDYGAGDTNVEELTLYGRTHPELKIQEKLVVVDSGASSERYDPVLKTMTKKRNKSLMVNQTAVSLESGTMLLPKEEEGDHRLLHQMQGYVINSVTARGDFTYAGEDHILDAFMLAVFGFYSNFSTVINTSYDHTIRRIQDSRVDNIMKNNRSDISGKSPILTTSNRLIRDPEAPPLYSRPKRRAVQGRTNIDNYSGRGRF